MPVKRRVSKANPYRVTPAALARCEPPRVARRLQLLRDWSHDEENLAL